MANAVQEGCILKLYVDLGSIEVDRSNYVQETTSESRHREIHLEKSIETKLDLLQRELQSKEVKLGELQSQIESKEMQLGELECQIESKEMQLGELDCQIESKEMQLGQVENSIEVCTGQLGLTNKELAQTKKLVSDCSLDLDLLRGSIVSKETKLGQVRNSIEEQESELADCRFEVEIKRTELEWVKKSIDERSRELEKRCEQFSTKEKEFDARLEEFNREKEQFKARLKAFDQEKQQFDIQKKCKEEPLQSKKSIAQLLEERPPYDINIQSSTTNLQSLANELAARRNELPNCMQLCHNRAKIVLDVISWNRNRGYKIYDDSFVKNCILMLEEILGLDSRVIGSQELGDAMKLAVEWKEEIKNPALNKLVVLGFLEIVAAFKLVESFDKSQIFKLFVDIADYKFAPKIFQELGLADKVSDLVKTLIEREQYTAAARFICSLQKMEKYNAVLLLHREIENRKRSLSNGINKRKVSPENIGADQDLAALSAVLECIADFKLESYVSIPPILILMGQYTKDSKAAFTTSAYSSSGCSSDQQQQKRPRHFQS